MRAEKLRGGHVAGEFRRIREQPPQLAVVELRVFDAVMTALAAIVPPQRVAESAQRIDLVDALDERLAAAQRLHQRVHVLQLLQRRPPGVALLPVRVRRQPDREGLGEVLVGMALRVPRDRCAARTLLLYGLGS